MSTEFALVAKAGGADESAENTCEACVAARAAKLPRKARLVFELDLRATADGALVALHDATLERTSNGRGPVACVTLSALRQLRAGPNGERVPTCEEVCEATEGHELVLDIHANEPGVAQALVRCLERFAPATRERIVVASEHDALIGAVRALCPRLRTAATAREAKLALLLGRLGLGRFSPRGHALFVPQSYRGVRVVTDSFVRNARRAGDSVWVWVVNDAPTAVALVALGVDGCFTTRPSALASELAAALAAG